MQLYAAKVHIQCDAMETLLCVYCFVFYGNRTTFWLNMQVEKFRISFTRFDITLTLSSFVSPHECHVWLHVILNCHIPYYCHLDAVTCAVWAYKCMFCVHSFTVYCMFLYVQITDSIAFINFTHERSVPYRKCDFFDEVLAHFTLYMRAWGLSLPGV